MLKFTYFTFGKADNPQSNALTNYPSANEHTISAFRRLNEKQFLNTNDHSLFQFDNCCNVFHVFLSQQTSLGISIIQFQLQYSCTFRIGCSENFQKASFIIFTPTLCTTKVSKLGCYARFYYKIMAACYSLKIYFRNIVLALCSMKLIGLARRLLLICNYYLCYYYL